jgi:acid stress-induced BolA-like protein IbaG/YrbA
MNPAEITKLIEAGFDGAVVQVMSGDNTHFEAVVVASEFEGQRPIKRHQLVYGTLGALVGNEIHALSLRTFTPEEWRQQTTES